MADLYKYEPSTKRGKLYFQHCKLLKINAHFFTNLRIPFNEGCAVRAFLYWTQICLNRNAILQHLAIHSLSFPYFLYFQHFLYLLRLQQARPLHLLAHHWHQLLQLKQ